MIFMSLFIELMENPIFALIILPILIFSARVADVSLGTLRVVFVSQGKKQLAPLVGFFEVFIWILAMGQIFSNVTNIWYYLAYAGGFATGNYIGLFIERKISLGYLKIQLILRDSPEKLINALKSEGFGLTTLTAIGTRGNRTLLIMVIKRKNESRVKEIIREKSPNAFISIEQIQSVKGGQFPIQQKNQWRNKRIEKKK
jgi:uncharacterized protein YebE (UPF0316 family)